jgi:hypothetical protein
LITNLLPGLRDLRTPLAVGYLWLVALWLLLHKYVPTSLDAAKGPLKSLYQLGDFVGDKVLLAAVTFVAYLLGSLLVKYFKARMSYDGKSEDQEGDFQLPNTSWFERVFMNGDLLVSATRQLVSFVDTRLRELQNVMDRTLHREILEARELPVVQEHEYEPIHNLRSAYVSGIVADFQLVGIQLQATNRDFWDTYDRKVTEMQFRHGIAPPLVAIIIIISWQSSWFWLFLLIIPVWFGVLAQRLSTEVKATLIQAIILGMVVPPILQDLDKAADKRREELKNLRVEEADLI